MNPTIRQKKFPELFYKKCVFKNFAKFKGKTQAFKHKARVTSFPNNPTDFYLFKLNNRNIRKSCEKCLKLTIKSPERSSELVLVSFRSYNSNWFCAAVADHWNPHQWGHGRGQDKAVKNLRLSHLYWHELSDILTVSTSLVFKNVFLLLQ